MINKFKGLFIIVICLLLCCGCGKETSSVSDSYAEESYSSEIVKEPDPVKLYIDIELVGATDSFAICIDDNRYEMDSTSYYTNLSEAAVGKHKISVTELSANKPLYEDEIEVNNDTRIKISMQYEDIWKVFNCTIDGNILDSAISYESVSGDTLKEALLKLSNKHFVNVSFASNNHSQIYDNSEWIVVSQNRSNGDVLDKTASVELVCRKVIFPVYLDFTFDKNLILAKYDLECTIDNESIYTLAHGTPYSALIKLHEGAHELKFSSVEDSSISVSQKFNVSGDLLIQGHLHTNSSDIELNDYAETASIKAFAGEVPDVVNMHLDDACKVLKGNGFENINKYSTNTITNESDWIVYEQSITPGRYYETNGSIMLKSKSAGEIYLEYYNGLNVAEANKKASSLGHNIKYVINGVSAGDLPEEEYGLWKIIDYCGTKGNIVFDLHYCGETEVPNLVGLCLDDARQKIKECRLYNVKEDMDISNDAYAPSEIIVLEQSVQPGKKCNAEDEIAIKCKTFADYYLDLYSGKYVYQIEDLLLGDKHSPIFHIIYTTEDISEKMLSLTYDEKKKWIVKTVRERSDAFDFGLVYSNEVVMPKLIDLPLDEVKEKLVELQIYDVKAMMGTVEVTFSDAYIVEHQNIKEDTIIDSSTPVTLLVIPKPVPQILYPQSTGKLAKDWDYDYSNDEAAIYINVDNVTNTPKLTKWGKAVVTDGVAEYLDYLVDNGCEINITNYSKKTPHKGFNTYESTFEVRLGELKWTMEERIEDEYYLEYIFYIYR